MLLMAATGLVNVYGLFYRPLVEKLAVGYTAVTFHYSIFFMTSGLFLPISSRIMIKYGLKKTMITGCMLIAVSGLLIANSNSIILINLFAVILGIGYSLNTYVFAMTVINNWFIKNRGLFMGLTTTCSGLVCMIYSPIMTMLINRFGYSIAYSVFTLSIIVLSIPFIVYCRLTPQQCGLLPYGGVKKTDTISDSTKSIEKANYKSGKFVKFAALMICLALPFSFVGHISNLAINNGFNDAVASLAVSVLMFGKLTFNVLVGKMADRFGVNVANVFCLVFSAIGLIALQFVHYSPIMFLFSAFIFSSFYGYAEVGKSLEIGKIYANSQYSRIASITELIVTIVGAVMVVIVSCLFDMMQSYCGVVIIIVICDIVAIILLKNLSKEK